MALLVPLLIKSMSREDPVKRVLAGSRTEFKPNVQDMARGKTQSTFRWPSQNRIARAQSPHE